LKNGQPPRGIKICQILPEVLRWWWADGAFFDQHRFWAEGEPSAKSDGFCTAQGQ
jgi:hypothetical protein